MEKFTPYVMKDYPTVETVDFPREIYISFAVCGSKCGVQEFIVDGQTQVCQTCGKLMFRMETRKYVIGE